MKQKQNYKQKPRPAKPAARPAAAPAPASPAKPRTPLAHSRWLIALVAVFSFLIYSNTLKHGYANDDLASVIENRVIQQGWGQLGDVLTKSNWYGYTQQNHSILRPFTGFTFATEVEFFGPNPHVHHFTNVALYALCCVVLFLVMRRLVSHIHPWLPLAVTLLFAAHPIHTEVVANIKSRDEILAFLFGLALPLYMLLRYVKSGKTADMALAVGFFFLGVFSKESAVTFLAVFPLTLYFFSKAPLRRILMLTLPFLAPAALYLLARQAWLDPAPAEINKIIDNVVFGATDFSTRFGTIAVIMLKYLELLVFPHPLSWDYSYNQIEITSLANIKAMLSVVVYVTLLAVAFFGLRKKKIWSYCILFYFATMSVYSNLFVPIHATVGERFLFSPSLAFCLLLGYGIFRLFSGKVTSEAPVSAKIFNYAQVLVAILVTAYTFKTIDRNKDWENSVTISKAGVLASPNSARTHTAYGSSLMQLGERTQDPNAKNAYFREALSETKKGIAIYDDDVNYIYNYGVLSYYLNDTATARRMFARAVEMEPTKLNALFNLGATYETAGNNQVALQYYQKVQKIDSAFQNVTYSVGNSAAKLQQHDLAIANLRAFLRRNPNHPDAHNVLGVSYYHKQQLPMAAHHFDKAKQLAPQRADFYANAGSVYYSMQQYAKAAQNYEQALKYSPGNPNYSSMLQTSRRLAGQ